MVQVIIDWFPTSIDDSYRKMKYSQRGRVSFCKEKERQAWVGRPSFSTGTGRYMLSDDLHLWFREIDPNYAGKVKLKKQWTEAESVKRRSTADRCAFVLDFDSPGLALMFKLRWSGHTDRG